MHCFASENQTYTGTWLFGVESWKSLKGQENLLLKNLQVKTRVENVWFLWWRIFFEGKCGIQSTNEMAFKRTVTLRTSFRFPAIRFDAPTLLPFSGLTHAHAKCPPVGWFSLSFVSSPQDTKEIEDQSSVFKVTPLSFAPLAEVRIPRRNVARAHFAVINKVARQFYLRSDTR